MMYFFVTIGAAAGSLAALAGCGWIAAFILVQLSTHLAITLGVGHLTRVPMQVRCGFLSKPASHTLSCLPAWIVTHCRPCAKLCVLLE